MKPKNICYYDDRIICDYLDEPGEIKTYECCTCPHVKIRINDNPLAGRAKYGVWVLMGILIAAFIAIIFFLSYVIKYVRA